MSSHINKEKITRTIELILEKIHTEADPHLLNEYRSLIRKNVSFFSRSYMAAYLLMRLAETFPSAQGAPSPGGRRRRTERPPREESHADPARYLPEEESARIFISIGRNRKVYPREIIGLISANTDAGRDDIGNIRILDNYSFVQIRTSLADGVIEALNGQQFRGRSLTVNYARNRKEEDPLGTESSTEDAGGDTEQ
jgi:hypothetical protein